jgi:hypothetical protein
MTDDNFCICKYPAITRTPDQCATCRLPLPVTPDSALGDPTCEYAKRGEPHPLGVECDECGVSAYPIQPPELHAAQAVERRHGVRHVFFGQEPAQPYTPREVAELWAVSDLRQLTPEEGSRLLTTARLALAAQPSAPTTEEYQRLQQTVAFSEEQYLKAHGGSWGTCKYQAENADLRAEIEQSRRSPAAPVAASQVTPARCLADEPSDYAERVQGWADGLALTHGHAKLKNHPPPCNGLDFCVAHALQRGVEVLLSERNRPQPAPSEARPIRERLGFIRDILTGMRPDAIVHAVTEIDAAIDAARRGAPL